MFRNIIIPLFFIVLTSALTIYCWFEDLPWSLMGIFGFLTLGVGSMYISYYIFNRLFPDQRNKSLPALGNLWSTYLAEKDKPQVYTRAGILGGLFCMVLVGAGIYGWIKGADSYSQYQLENYGQETNAVITGSGYSKGLGTYREYAYTIPGGKTITDRFSNKRLGIGDSIRIRYSSRRPVINEVQTPQDDE
ncbi:MAG: hypothetical protein J0L54_11720 [Chitinophagales bacterium]|nr:hypothetical protein [Chitinophagales bacterium]